MNKILKMLVALAVGVVPMVIFSAMDDIAFVVKSPIVSHYADETPIADGERYVVTWTSSTNSFAGFKQDGTLVDPSNSTILATMAAKDSKLKLFLLQIDKNILSGGTYQLCLLDTRSRNSKTGELEHIDSESYEVRSYAELVSNFKYTSQFSTMEPTLGDASFKTAVGFEEKPFVPDFALPNDGYVPDEIAGTPYDVVQTGFYTNKYDYVDVLSNTKTTFYDIWRCFDAVSYKTNVVFKTIEVPILHEVFVTNVVKTAGANEPLLAASMKKNTVYEGFVVSKDNMQYDARISLYKPNSYGLSRATIRFKIAKKTFTKTLYGVLDDNDHLVMYGNIYDLRLEFNGEDIDGRLVYDGEEYEIIGEFVK